MDTEEIEFSRIIEKERSVYNIMTLVPHTKYSVSIKVQSADMTSEMVTDNSITMIDRKSLLNAHTKLNEGETIAGVGQEGLQCVINNLK